jgi:DNA-binding transcriptional LysR family regulator
LRYDLTSLHVFAVAAEELNLTRASKRLHLAVSAVSKRITELEQSIGSPLLVRLPRGVALTPAGQSLLHHSRLILDATQAMTQELEGYASGVKGHIRVYANTSALAQHLPRELEAFLREYPLVRVDLEERVGGAIIDAVADGRADFGVFGANTAPRGFWKRSPTTAIRSPLRCRAPTRLRRARPCASRTCCRTSSLRRTARARCSCCCARRRTSRAARSTFGCR